MAFWKQLILFIAQGWTTNVEKKWEVFGMKYFLIRKYFTPVIKNLKYNNVVI